jgi:hypothetical protein
MMAKYLMSELKLRLPKELGFSASCEVVPPGKSPSFLRKNGRNFPNVTLGYRKPAH